MPRDQQQPSNVQASPSGDGRVTISWDAVPGAERYAVAEKVGTSYRTFTLDARGTSYTADDLANGVEHRFLVQAYKRGRWSSFSDSDLVAATPTGTVKPAGVAAEPSDAAVTLSWRAVPGAERYAVASRNADGSYTTYTYDCRSTSFTVRGLLNGRPYEFLVQSYAGGRWSAFDGSDLARCVPDDGISPKVSASVAGDGELLLEWSAVPNATAYAIAEYKNGRFYTFTTECKATSFLASNLSNGRSHSFLVQAYVDGRWSSSSLGLLCFGTPTGTMKPSVVARPGYQSAKLSWNKVPGAARYAVALRLSNGSYRTLTYDCRSTSYVVEDLPGSTTHIFIVQAECDGVWSQFDSSDFVTVTPSGPTALEYLGYQNPSHLFQVSHNSVRIPHQGEGIFGYRTESRITRRATRNDCINAMICRAIEYLGTPYIWDYACAPGVGVDCAGLVMQSLYAAGMDLFPMTPWDHYYTPGHDQYANYMWNCGKFQRLPFSQRQRGDLIYNKGHIAIYLGNDQIIEAYPRRGVHYANVYSNPNIVGVLRPFV